MQTLHSGVPEAVLQPYEQGVVEDTLPPASQNATSPVAVQKVVNGAHAFGNPDDDAYAMLIAETEAQPLANRAARSTSVRFIAAPRRG